MGEVTDDAAQHRYTITVDGTIGGYIEYHDRGEQRVLVHTVVDDRFEGQGVGSKLVRGALDDVRRRGLGVVPTCPFVRSYLERHPDYVDLVPAERRAEFGLADVAGASGTGH